MEGKLFYEYLTGKLNNNRKSHKYSNNSYQRHHHTLLYKSKLVNQVVHNVFSTIPSCKYSRDHVHRLCVDKMCHDKTDLDNMSQVEYLTYQNKLAHDILFMIRM